MPKNTVSDVAIRMTLIKVQVVIFTVNKMHVKFKLFIQSPKSLRGIITLSGKATLLNCLPSKRVSIPKKNEFPFRVNPFSGWVLFA